MISGIDPSGYAITGVPVANDSTTESPKGSAKSMRCSNASAPPSNASRSAGPTGPAYVMPGVPRCGSTSSRK